MIKGKIHKFGDDVNTDVIIPARYLNTFDISELKNHCMEDLDPDFLKKISAGDIIVAGKNFGCGSSREHAPAVIKASGISCVVAKSFARIFYRNAINIGLPILECDNLFEEADEGDILEISLEEGSIRNLRNGSLYSSAPFPEYILGIINDGGLLKHISKK